MQKQSAGILSYRYLNNNLEVLLVHPGGPFWMKKDEGAWSIPKGEYLSSEDPLTVALRELQEETGFIADGNFIPLHAVKIKSGKIIHAWAVEADFDASKFTSNTFQMEWPPRSGKFKSIPEVDKAAWFSIPVAKQKINAGQLSFLTSLQQALSQS